MKAGRIALIILCLAGMVLGSVYVGARIGFEMARKKYQQRSDPESWNIQAMRVLDRELKLTDGQYEEVRVLMNEAVGHLTETRAETLKQSDRVVSNLIAAIDAGLTPRQQIRFREMIKDRKRVTAGIIGGKGEIAPGRKKED